MQQFLNKRLEATARHSFTWNGKWTTNRYEEVGEMLSPPISRVPRLKFSRDKENRELSAVYEEQTCPKFTRKRILQETVLHLDNGERALEFTTTHEYSNNLRISMLFARLPVFVLLIYIFCFIFSQFFTLCHAHCSWTWFPVSFQNFWLYLTAYKRIGSHHRFCVLHLTQLEVFFAKLAHGVVDSMRLWLLSVCAICAYIGNRIYSGIVIQESMTIYKDKVVLRSKYFKNSCEEVVVISRSDIHTIAIHEGFHHCRILYYIFIYRKQSDHLVRTTVDPPLFSHHNPLVTSHTDSSLP
uniref:Peptide chain release factor 1 n=1 Tax=Lygus hesperus TaxID=30085 RepID=A0A0A9YCH4_LYGHE